MNFSIRAFTTSYGLNIVLLALMVVLTPNLTKAAPAPSSTISIGTGGKTGVYFPTGNAICEAVKNEQNHKIPCVVKNTAGSVENIERLRTGDINFALVQADILYYAVNGYGPFNQKGPFPTLRTVLSLFTETFTVMTRADSGIKTFDDLKGKRVNIGNLGSGQRTSMELIMHMKGWTKKEFSQTSELSSTDQAMALCNNKVDAIVFVAANPNASIKTAAQSCKTVLVDVVGPVINKLVQKYPYLQRAMIPGKIYPGSPLSTPTYGVQAVLVTTTNVSKNLVLALLASVSFDFTDFLFSHPALHSLTQENIAPRNTIAPIHIGAAQFYH